MKAFVTGSTGLLGCNLVRGLRARGDEVCALARSRQKAARVLPDDHVGVVSGNMSNVSTFARHLATSDVVFHCAAYYREYRHGQGDHWPQLEQINIRATIALLDAAEAAGVGRVVYVSSSGVLGTPTHGDIVDEDTPYADDTDNLYFKSKVLAERAVLQWAETHALPVVTILPGWMFGPWDDSPTASGRLIQRCLDGRLPLIPPGGASVVDARDVAAAMIRASEAGEAGDRYLVAGRQVALGELVAVIDRLGTSGARHRFTVPYPVAVPMALVLQQAAGVLGRRSPLTVSALRELRRGLRYKYSSARAQRELGAEFRSLATTLGDEINWYRRREACHARARP